MLLKSGHFSGTDPSKWYIKGLHEGRYAPFYLVGLKGAAFPFIAKKIFRPDT
jgi:hypothetical protein